MAKLKILMTAERFPPNVFGGGEFSAYFVAKTMAKKHAVHVITSKTQKKNDDIKFNEIQIPSSMQVHRLVKPSGDLLPGFIQNHEAYYVKSFRVINSFLKKHDGFDLLHSMSMNMVVGTVQAAKKHNIPVIATVNDHWATCFFRSHFRNCFS